MGLMTCEGNGLGEEVQCSLVCNSASESCNEDDEEE